MATKTPLFKEEKNQEEEEAKKNCQKKKMRSATTGLVLLVCLVVGTRAQKTSLLNEDVIEAKLRGQKVVENWSGDVVDAGMAFSAGVAASLAVKAASGLAMQAAIMGAIVAGGAWTGIITVHWDIIRDYLAKVFPFLKDDFTQRFDLDGDGRLSPADAEVFREKLRKIATRNSHSTAGAIVGLVVGMLLL